MAKAFTLSLAALGLGGCGVFETTGEAVVNPPIAVLEAVRSLFYWFGSLATVFFQALFDQIF